MAPRKELETEENRQAWHWWREVMDMQSRRKIVDAEPAIDGETAAQYVLRMYIKHVVGPAVENYRDNGQAYEDAMLAQDIMEGIK